jgi:hypothetical protein
MQKRHSLSQTLSYRFHWLLPSKLHPHLATGFEIGSSLLLSRIVKTSNGLFPIRRKQGLGHTATNGAVWRSGGG